MKATRFLLALLAMTTFATAGDDVAQLQAKLKELEDQIQQLKQLQQQLEQKQADPAAAPAQPAPAPAPAVSPKIFQYRMATLRGRSLQPAGGLQPAAGLQPAPGVQASAAEAGAAPAVTRPMTDEQWRQLFPVKNGAK